MSDPIRRQDLPPIHEPQAPVRVAFQQWLDEIDDELIGGALLVAEALPRSARAFLGRDLTVVDEVRAMASDVNDRCRRVEEQGFLLLARESPVAGDLRRLVGILRLVTAVERSAALLRHVGEAVERVDAPMLPAEIRTTIEELAAYTAEVFRRGVDAWRQRDGLAVHEVDRLDESVDRLQEHLLDASQRQVDGAAELLVLGLLARYYERIADHGVSFAQHATFAVTGERVDVGR
ncbi:phosphate uptake regulator PhoU [Egicoccus sp. AB-alg2]|uniref:phosphate signaling complex PhoU family protein n=1 Tax=Egicoccus sp. AB-alg2 TaxID=3242693 RepID=UPI00359D19E7